MGFTFIRYMLHPGNTSKVFIIVPAYNEQQVIGEVLHELSPLQYQLVLVDDGSANELNLPASIPVHLLRHRINLGQGAALQTGIEFALENGADYIVSFDADGQHTAADIPHLLEPLYQHKADVALGSRFLDNSSQVPAGRKILLQIARYANYLFTGLLLTDAHNGMRAFNKSAANKIRIRQNGMAHATEIIAEIKKHKLRYKEVPVMIRYTEYSKKKGQSVWSSFRIFFDILLNKIFK